jgi:Fe-S-cluster-containing dehydrogenase component
MAEHYGMVIDLDACIGCHACSIACKIENSTDINTDTEIDTNWHRVEPMGDPKGKVGEDIPLGVYPDLSLYWLPMPCQHCEHAPCAVVCPAAAITKRTDGIVLVDKLKCIGCKYCSWVCPYNMPQYSLEDGTMEKCTFCVHRVDQSLEPACVIACVYGARFFGDLNDPHSEISKLIASKRGGVLLPEQGTLPSVYYVGSRRR